MATRQSSRLHSALLGLLPVAACTLALALWVIPLMPGLAPFLAGWWVLGIGLASVRWQRVWVPAALCIPLALPPLVVTVLINFHAVRVEGTSMLPLLHPGDVLLVDETVAPETPLAVYVINVPGEENNPMIKRLLGMPGQTITAAYDRLFADGQEVFPRLGDAPDTWNKQRPMERRGYVNNPLDLGADEYFFAGDNPPQSRDSRHYGPIKRADVQGRIVWSLKGSRGFGPVE
jgi:signal peptidase I